jgi:hypothetical protein
MSFDSARGVLRSWEGEEVVVRLDPEGTVMAGPLAELESGGLDAALFAVDREHLSGVAIALFRDAVGRVTREGDRLVVEQGRVTLTVTRSSGPTCGGRRSARE